MSHGGKNEYAKFGEVASEEEREAASKVLAENLKARQAGEWEAQCSSLTKEVMEELVPSPGSGPLVEVCGKELKHFAEPLAKTAKVREDNLNGEISVLRIEGNHAFALFHGPEGKNFAMRMAKEDGEWKVATLLTSEIN